MLTYILFKTKSMLLSATSRKGQPHADLPSVQNPEHALVSNRKGQPDPDLHAVQHFCQQQAGRASQILTYSLFNTQSMCLSTTSKKGQPDANLQTVQNPEHFPVRNKQEGPARC